MLDDAIRIRKYSTVRPLFGKCLVSHPRIILAMRVGGHYHYSIMLLY